MAPSPCVELRQACEQLTEDFPGYDEIIRQILLALLTREHLLLIGEPGTGKSQLALSLFGMFQGVPIFREQMRPSTSADDIFGQTIINQVMEGHRIRNIEGGLLTAVFAYLDEIFDTPDMILRGTLLTALNERAYRSKDQSLDHLPLHTVIATTNFERLTEAIVAVLDRFIFKSTSPRVTTYPQRMGMYDTYLEGRASKLPAVDYDELREMSDRVHASAADGGIEISGGFMLMHAYVISAFEAAHRAMIHDRLVTAMRREPTPAELARQLPNISPRTENRQFDISRALAVLWGRDHVVLPDIGAYKYGLLTIGQDPEAEALWDQICHDALPHKDSDLRQLEKLGQIAATLRQMKAEEPRNSRAANVAAGRVPTATALSIREWLGKRRGTHPTLQAITISLEAEAEHLGDAPSPTSINLEDDWAE